MPTGARSVVSKTAGRAKGSGGPLSPKWVVVGLLFTGLTLDYFSRLALFSVIPLWRTDLHASDTTIGLVVSLFLFTYGLLAPVAGFLGDYFSRRTLLIGSVILWSLITTACALVASGPQLVALRALLGVAQAPFMPVSQAYIADFHGEETRARASGYCQTGAYAGIILAGLPAAWLATAWGWRAMLMMCGLVGIALGVSLLVFLPHSARSTEGRKPVPAARYGRRWDCCACPPCWY